MADAVKLEADVLGSVLGWKEFFFLVGGGGSGRRKVGVEEKRIVVVGIDLFFFCRRSELKFSFLKLSLSLFLTWDRIVVSDDLNVLAVARRPRVGDEDAVEGEVLFHCE